MLERPDELKIITFVEHLAINEHFLTLYIPAHLYLLHHHLLNIYLAVSTLDM